MSSETLTTEPRIATGVRPETAHRPGETAIECRGVGKCYHIYDRPQDRLKQALLRWTGRRYFHEFWALRGVTFDVRRGESVGIIGRNGSGKTTLLQLIAGTVAPTEGSVLVRGRTAALLELGSGFNPEFTGRENVYLNGSILGIPRDEMHRRFDDIAAFADIGEFLDQPVKTYSSGMHLRLAFAVASSIEPDILIIDESLAVGDLLFQARCIARIRRLLDGGTTLLLVSHGLDAVRSLCRRCLWLDAGRVRDMGESTVVTEEYARAMYAEHNAATSALAVERAGAGEAEFITRAATRVARAGDHDSPVRIRRVSVLDSQGCRTEALAPGQPFAIEVELEAAAPMDHVSVGILIKDRHGVELTGESVFNSMRRGLSLEPGRPRVVRFEGENVLRHDPYSVAVRVNRVSRWDRGDNVLLYADDVAAAFQSLADPQSPMWFRFRMPFRVSVS